MRRISVRLSASAEGATPISECFARMKRSIGFRAQSACGEGSFGVAGRRSGVTDQCSSHLAPCSIQLRKVAISAAESFLPLLTGGMRSSASECVIRASTSFSAGLASSSTSSRKSPLRDSPSGPWH